MWAQKVGGWERTDRERLFTAFFAESGVASSEALLSLLTALHRGRPNEWAHAQRVGAIARRIGEELGLPDRQLVDLERAGWLHDLGKMVVPDRSDATTDIVEPVDVAIWTRQLFAAVGIIDAAPALRAAGALVLASRECMDGSGFPRRLSGERIPMGARILHVADTYDALTELCVVYSVTHESINVELARHVGTRFDAAVVAAWLRCSDAAAPRASTRSGERAGSLF
jgi:response regulator RpfG family c-di-GMP phosphodiesterase